MERATILIGELEKLVSSESYPEALALLEQKGAGILDAFSHSATNQKLLLLAADINIRNLLNCEAESYLDKLIEECPDIEHDFDFVIQRVRLLLLQCDYDNCSIYLDCCLNRDWSENRYHWLKYYAGLVAFWKGDHFKSNRLFEECHSHARSAKDRFLAGSSSYMLGYVAYQRCFFEIATVNYSRALENFCECGKCSSQGHTYKMLAILAYRTGEYDRSEKLLKLAFECFEKTGNRRDIINSNIALGRVNIFRGQYKEAEPLLLDSRKGASESGFRREMALSSEFLGELCYHQHRYDESLIWLKEAEEIVLEIAPDGDVAVEVYRRLGDVYLALGKIEDAEIALSKAHRLCESLNDQYELGSVLRAYGMVAFMKNDMELAMSFFNEAIVTLKLIKESFELGRTLQLAAESCEKWGTENETDLQTRNDLFQKARDHAIEAMHLFSSKDLAGRAEACRDLVHRLECRIDSSDHENRYQEVRFDEKYLIEDSIIAASDSIKEVISRVRSLAPGTMPVLVSGETGTGKEIIARLLHKSSNRSEGSFVPVNCAAIPDTVFESELFGYKKGAFTGAIADKEGLFERASGGTLFLDEITELSARKQAKLLRAVQEQAIRRVGETRERPVDVRLVSASNEDLLSMVESGKLRKDFYYRISGGVIELEPLRNRKDDILPLFSYFLCGSDGEFSIEEGLTELLLEYHWPGNVRELINVARELALLGQSGRVVRKRDLPLIIKNYHLSEPRNTNIASALSDKCISSGGNGSGARCNSDLHRRIKAAMIRHNGNKTAIAQDLGIGRSTLYRRLRELGIA